MAKANDRQIGGGHYKTGGEEHWDRVYRLDLDYFQACITKYVERCWKKNGIQDLEKARHFLDKYIELHTDEDGCHIEADGSCTGKSDCMHAPPPSMLDKEHPFSIGYNTGVYVHGEVLPTGWAQFVFEGADQEGYLYTCRECNAHFRAPPYTNPHLKHACHFIADCAAGVVDAQVDEGAPTSAYTNQG